MRDTIRRLSLLTALVVAGIVFPSMVAAQKTPEGLERRATGVVNSQRALRKSADLLVKAAQLRGPADPIGVADLTGAANVYYFTGKIARARELCVQAAEHALAIGDVDRAAHAFLFAAIVANRQGDRLVRDSLMARANLLAGSPILLSSNQQGAHPPRVASTTNPPVTIATEPDPKQP